MYIYTCYDICACRRRQYQKKSHRISKKKSVGDGMCNIFVYYAAGLQKFRSRYNLIQKTILWICGFAWNPELGS